METIPFALYLSQQLGRLNLTQAEAAQFLDVSPRTIWSWLKGSLVPSRCEEAGAKILLESWIREDEPTFDCGTIADLDRLKFKPGIEWQLWFWILSAAKTEMESGKPVSVMGSLMGFVRSQQM